MFMCKVPYVRGLSGGEDGGAPFPVRREGRERHPLSLCLVASLRAGSLGVREWVHDSLDELA